MMGEQIHARKVEDGWLYRVWSTVVDDYVSEEMVESEVAGWLIKDAIEGLMIGLPDRLGRTRTRGTSSLLEERDVEGPWDEPMQFPYDSDDDDGRLA